MSLSIQERLERRRKSKGRMNFDEEVKDSPSIVADILVSPDVKQRIQKREQAAFLPMDEKAKVFDELNTSTDQPSEERARARDSAVTPSELLSTQKTDTNRTQTAYKPDINRAQTGHKVDTATPLAISPPNETGHKPDTQPDTRLDTNRTQTAHKLDTTSGFGALTGIQRQITILLYDSCKAARARVTDPITLEHVAGSLKIRLGSVKTSIRRLEEKQIAKRVEYRNGRGGWSRYELPEDIFREMLQLETGHKLNTNRTQTGHKVDTQPDTQPDTSLSSSSSFLNSENLKTTTGDGELLDASRVQLAPEWVAVDFASLADVGFSRAHVVQLARHGKLSAAEVQDSIHFFAFDLKRNEKGREIKGPPVNFFMGILRKGLPYAPPENYESPEAEARRKYLEGKRRLEELRHAEDREIRDLDFSEWRRGLSHDELNTIVPDVVRHIPKAQESSLRAHFDENVWPSRRAAILGTIELERTEIKRQIDQALGESAS